jgi:hypothetical protein
MDADSSAEIRDIGASDSLWTRVRAWVLRWTCVFSPEEIMRDGLTRRLALRCSSWLASLEAATRRLIIAAALVVDPAQLSPARADSSAPRRRPASKKTAKLLSFRLISIRGSNAPRPAASPPGRRAAPPRHLPFPGDDLLRLGPARFRHPRPTLRQPHPLVRRGRIFPYDPDYIPREACSTSPRSGDTEVGHTRPLAADRRFRTRLYAEISGEEWRRVDMEWERVLPAPGLAARIAALVQAVEDPGPLVHRLARRLVADPGLAAVLRGLPSPVTRRPAYDRIGPQVDEDLVRLCHAGLPPPDTS